MSNIAHVLKNEIARVARKEIRAETDALKKAAGLHRSEIAALKRRTQALEQELRRLTKATEKVSRVEAATAQPTNTRYSTKSLSSQRRRLGLSAAECGLLIGASSQSVYNWEEGSVRPQAKHLPAIAALRTMGRKDSRTRLTTLQSTQ